ncbi:unnamed protein product [Blepharisma stoltei]|uniref:Uncharacterized protein n=1 Tax=Blepharisma stoltei TaxID=1481888 RepID=A0AAU9IKY9_9CILI|nr:unnamed protein product [Blepharisma stoltei]
MFDDASYSDILKRKRIELANLNKKKDRIIDENEILAEQLENYEQKIEDKKKELAYKQGKEDETIEIKSSFTGGDAERREKELEEWVKYKLIDLIKTDDESEGKDKRTRLQEYESEVPLIITSVYIRFVPGLRDGDFEKFEKMDPHEALFKINKTTTFHDLKATACEFWQIKDPDSVGFRANNFALLGLFMDENVQECIINERIPPEFWLFSIDNQAKSSFTTLNDCFLDPSIISQFKVGSVKRRFAGRARGLSDRQHMNNFKKLSEMYKGLESFKRVDIDLNDDAILKEKTQGSYASFNTMIIILVCLAISAALNIVRRNVNSDYWLQKGINQGLLVDFSDQKNYWAISTFDDVDKFVINVLAPNVFNSQYLYQNNFIRRYYLVGPVRIRQVRTKEMDCPEASNWDISSNFTCYHQAYTSSTKYTENIEGKTDSWNVYQSASETGIDWNFDGEFSSYDGSGYIYDSWPSNTTKEQFINSYMALKAANWIWLETRGLFLSFNLYAPTYEKFISVCMVMEISTTGLVFPTYFHSSVFKLFHEGTSKDDSMLILEIVRFILGFYLLYITVRMVMRKTDDSRNYQYLFTTRGVGDLIIFCLIVSAFAFNFKHDIKKSHILREKYTDLQQSAEDYNTYITLNAWLILLFMLRMLSFLNITKKVGTYLLTMQMAARNVICLIFILGPILLGLLMVTYNIYGANNYYWRTFSWNILSDIMFLLGLGSIDDLIKLAPTWTVGFLYVYFFAIVFFLFSAFLALLIDTYRRVFLRNKSLSIAKKEQQDKVKSIYKEWLYSSAPCFKPKPEEEKHEDSEEDNYA